MTGPGPAHRLVRAGVPDADRSGGPRRGLAAGRFRRRGHGGLCAGHRSAGPAPAAAVHGSGRRQAPPGRRSAVRKTARTSPRRRWPRPDASSSWAKAAVGSSGVRLAGPSSGWHVGQK